MMMVAWVEILPGAIVTCDLTQDILGGLADQLELVCKGRKKTKDKLILRLNVLCSQVAMSTRELDIRDRRSLVRQELEK